MAGVHELKVALHPLHAALPEMVQECLGALVQARDEGAGGRHGCLDPVVAEDRPICDCAAVEAPMLAVSGFHPSGEGVAQEGGG